MMKTFLYFALLSIIISFAACNKYEEYPVERMTEEVVWDSLDRNATFAQGVVNGIYGLMPDGFNRINNVILDAATDDAVASQTGHGIEILGKSRLTAVNNPDDFWTNAYEAVRRVNLFLANIDAVPFDAAIKTRWKAEVRFIRALSYFELIKRYGGVPLVGDAYYYLEDEIDVPRSSFDAVVDYIVSECDAAIPDLFADPVPDISQNLGRVTQDAARSLKGRVLLYAASPLNNPENDREKWQAAYDAIKAIVDRGKYSLAPSFANHFTNRTSPEVILAKQQPQNQNLERLNAPVGYIEPNLSQGWISPTQNLVDAFPMANGIAINDQASGYDPQDPYSGRDPRLYATVFHDGMNWLGRPVETFEDGRDNPGSKTRVARRTRTGYYMRKFLGNFANASAYSNHNHNFPIFRYTETLLNYAEAANELGMSEESYTQLVSLRKRAGIQAGEDNLYGLRPSMNKEELREAIRLERRLELAFEEHRFWDLRRWKIANRVLNSELNGVSITRDGRETLTYNYLPVEYVSFAEKHYLYPIPYNEVVGNKGRITQNPGW